MRRVPSQKFFVVIRNFFFIFKFWFILFVFSFDFYFLFSSKSSISKVIQIFWCPIQNSNPFIGLINQGNPPKVPLIWSARQKKPTSFYLVGRLIGSSIKSIQGCPRFRGSGAQAAASLIPSGRTLTVDSGQVVRTECSISALSKCFFY